MPSPFFDVDMQEKPGDFAWLTSWLSFRKNVASILLAIGAFICIQDVLQAGCHLVQSGNWYLSHRESIDGPRFDDPLHVFQSRGQVIYEGGEFRFAPLPLRTPCEGAGCRSDESQGMVPFVLLPSEQHNLVSYHGTNSILAATLSFGPDVNIGQDSLYLPIDLDVLEHPPK